MLIRKVSRWWVLALRGVLAVIFGIIALVWPNLTLLSLVIVFGTYALVDGIFAVIAGVSSIGRGGRWWAMLLVGLSGIGIGLLTFFNPGITALVLLMYIAAWAIISGVFEIVSAIQLRKVISNEWVMIASGFLSVLFGVLLVLFPGAGALSVTWIIGSFALVFGILLIILAFRLRGMIQDNNGS